jgi:hypothetical protein
MLKTLGRRRQQTKRFVVSDDIVTLLLEMIADPQDTASMTVLMEAVDEIERLRAENVKLNSVLYRMKRITQDQTEDYI